MDVKLAFYYGLGGAGWSLMRFYYKKMKDDVEFEPKRMVKTVLIGFGVGLYAAYLGQEASEDVFQAIMETGSSGMMITAIADSVVNFGLRAYEWLKEKL